MLESAGWRAPPLTDFLYNVRQALLSLQGSSTPCARGNFCDELIQLQHYIIRRPCRTMHLKLITSLGCRSAHDQVRPICGRQSTIPTSLTLPEVVKSLCC